MAGVLVFVVRREVKLWSSAEASIRFYDGSGSHLSSEIPER